MKKILHPTDFSENALKALEFAVDLSKKFNAELILLHVADLPSVISGKSFFSSFSELGDAEKDSTIAKLKEYAAKYPDTSDSNFKIQFIAKLNSSPKDGVLEAINETGADLVVVGTKGQSRLIQMIVGSTTKALVESAPCPVLAIPENAVFREINQIVYASDFDPNDIPAIKKVIPISQVYHAKVAVLHLFQNELKEKDEAKAFQKRLHEEVKYVHLKYDTDASYNIAESLVNYLKVNQADLLVMFEKEKTGIIGWFQKGMVKQFVDYAETIPFMSFNVHSVKSPKKEEFIY